MSRLSFKLRVRQSYDEGEPSVRAPRGSMCVRGTQVGEYREHAPISFLRGRYIELGEDVTDVGFDGALAEVQVAGDASIGQPLGHELEHLTFTIGELGESVV